MFRILFIGATWKGSSARSLREGLELIPDVTIDEIGEDHYCPIYESKILRGFNRLLKRWQIAEFEKDIIGKIESFQPMVIVVYKGECVRACFLKLLVETGIKVINVFPDQSPHIHGSNLRESMGIYDLVISTKTFHPVRWKSIYGYDNQCVFVPHGYDPAVHYWSGASAAQDLDIVLAASWRPEYHKLMLDFAVAVGGMSMRVALSGPGWKERRGDFPPNWEFEGPFYGRAYGTWLRRGKIVIAPVHTQVAVHGVEQPGDEDTTRSYELAAAGCFFLHRRTAYIQTVYDEQVEVPMWDDASELVALVRHYLPLESKRAAMAERAHRRAVPAYSIPSRAKKVLEMIQTQVGSAGGLQ